MHINYCYKSTRGPCASHDALLVIVSFVTLAFCEFAAHAGGHRCGDARLDAVNSHEGRCTRTGISPESVLHGIARSGRIADVRALPPGELLEHICRLRVRRARGSPGGVCERILVWRMASSKQESPM